MVPQSIPTKLFKTFNKALRKPFTNLINLFFIKGLFQNVLKAAQVLPTFKKRCKTDTNNYKPISLISNVNKKLEKLLYKRLNSFQEENNGSYPDKFGFNPNHSTNSALIEITEQIRKACHRGLFVCRVYLNFKKTFDINSQHTTNKTETFQSLSSFVPNRQEQRNKCKRKQFKLPRNCSLSSPRVCTTLKDHEVRQIWFSIQQKKVKPGLHFL